MPATGLNRYVPDWSVTSAPGAGVKATATRPASPAPPLAESRHVCTSVSATLVSAGTTAQQTVNLLDGATVLASWILAVPATAGACVILALDSLEIIGSPNTAMTLEFAALAAANFESVTMTGHTL